MKRKILLIACALLGTLMTACQKNDGRMDCTIYWQLYHTPKHLSDADIEQAYSETFYGFWDRVNDNSVIAREVTQSDVRSLTLKLCSMADAKIKEQRDPSATDNAEMRVFINFAGKYVEEIWSRTY